MSSSSSSASYAAGAGAGGAAGGAASGEDPYKSPPRPRKRTQRENNLLLLSAGSSKSRMTNASMFSEAEEVPEELLEPNIEANGLRVVRPGGTSAYLAPEGNGSRRLNIIEEEKERARRERARTIFNKNFIQEYKKGNPNAHRKLQTLKNAATGKVPLPVKPLPPPSFGPLRITVKKSKKSRKTRKSRTRKN
jgi:hypothetical protein